MFGVIGSTNGCSSKPNLNTGFLKKPLVALALLVVITMCVTMTESAPSRTRHHRGQGSHDRIQHPSHSMSAHQTKDHRNKTDKTFKVKKYQEDLSKIKRRILLIRKNIREGSLVLKEQERPVKSEWYKPPWVPKLHMLAVHEAALNKTGMKKKLKSYLPHLYEHVQQYQVIFNLLKEVRIISSANIFSSLQNRKRLIDNTIDSLNAFYKEVIDSMINQKVEIKKFDSSKMKVSDFKTELNSFSYEFLDRAVYRAFENFLLQWTGELTCRKKLGFYVKNQKTRRLSKNQKPEEGIQNNLCRKYLGQLEKEKETRIKKIRPKTTPRH